MPYLFLPTDGTWPHGGPPPILFETLQLAKDSLHNSYNTLFEQPILIQAGDLYNVFYLKTLIATISPIVLHTESTHL